MARADKTALTPKNARAPRLAKAKPARAAAPEPELSLPSITARLLAIAAAGEAIGAGPIKDLNSSIRWMRDPAPK